MRFPLTAEDRSEMQRFGLRSSCQHCFFYCLERRVCAHEWPTNEQERWPLCGEDGSQPAEEIQLCKEFELR